MLEAVLFDLGDTLLDFTPLDSRAAYRVSVRRTYAYLKERGHSLPSLWWYSKRHVWQLVWAYLGAKFSGRELNGLTPIRLACQKMGIAADQALLEELAWLWYLPAVDHASVEHDAIATLAMLRDRGLKLGLVSNTVVPGCVLDRHMRDAGLIDFFPVRIYSSEVGVRKPDPRIFELALGKLGVAPERAVFVGDKVAIDVAGARRVGLRTVLKQPGANGHGHAVADHVIRRISELPQFLPINGHALACEASR